MPDLNLRNVDVTLVTRLKSEAALFRMGLRDYCVALLEAGKFEGEPAWRRVDAESLQSSPPVSQNSGIPRPSGPKKLPPRVDGVRRASEKVDSGQQETKGDISNTVRDVPKVPADTCPDCGERTVQSGKYRWCQRCQHNVW